MTIIGINYEEESSPLIYSGVYVATRTFSGKSKVSFNSGNVEADYMSAVIYARNLGDDVMLSSSCDHFIRDYWPEYCWLPAYNLIDSSNNIPSVIKKTDALDLKCWPEYYERILSGIKTFEVRSNTDRKFKEGQYIVLSEFDPETGQYTGRKKLFVIGFVLSGDFGIPDDISVISLLSPY